MHSAVEVVRSYGMARIPGPDGCLKLKQILHAIGSVLKPPVLAARYAPLAGMRVCQKPSVSAVIVLVPVSHGKYCRLSGLSHIARQHDQTIVWTPWRMISQERKILLINGLPWYNYIVTRDIAPESRSLAIKEGRVLSNLISGEGP